MFDLKTLVDVISRVAAGNRQRAVLWQDEAGRWQSISTGEFAARICALAAAFESWGISKGDRIALLAENRWEWPVTDFASLVLGAVDVPIYPTLTAGQTADLLIDSGARVAVVSTAAQYRKVASIRGKTPLERIVVMDEMPEETGGHPDAAIPFRSLIAGAKVDAAAPDVERALCRSNVQPQDLATLIYTSGTTGEPKGVMLTHGNIASNLNYSTDAFQWGSTSSCISFLPLSHITARHLDYALFAYGATLAYCSDFKQLPGALTAVKPTIFVAVPRVYEKIRQEVEHRAGLKPMTQKLLNWAISTGRQHRELILRGQSPKALRWRLADRLVFRKIRAGAFGGRVIDYISGGAPLGLETASWFADAGIRIYEGYGLSETAPVLALNNARDHRIGSVGKPIESVEYRLEPDGELLVRGPFLFTGYWHKPQATAEAIDEQGWFHTGDIGRLDEDGFLYITDRKKELLKTSGGKTIAPQQIESKLRDDLMVAQAALVGDRRQFLCALISPNFAALESWAHRQGIAFTTRADLVKAPLVHAKYDAIVEKVNAMLANFETIKRFYVVADEWSIESGELTPSMKLKRRVVTARYPAEISAFYNDDLWPRR